MSPETLTATAKTMAAAVKAHFQKSIDAMVARFDDVEKRIAAIPAGERGAQGDAGTAGAQGDKGDVGERGENGADGMDGKDGAPGNDGAAGGRGENGADGEDGKDGAPGNDGAAGGTGEQGQKGIDGVAGDPGRDGRDGAAGEPGRDALEIDIRDGIDESKSYPRGTFATYRGGIIRALRATDPVTDGIAKAGWQVVLDGIAGVEHEHDPENASKLMVAITRTSGARHDVSMYLPSMRYRGVFREADYLPGDCATWNGSLWHCDSPTSDKPGEIGSKGWTLAVKRGRDGKDGSNVAPRVIGPVKA